MALPAIQRRSFRDFDSFREHLRGWDTDPVQLSAGPLQLAWDELSLDELSVAHLRVNQRIADVSAVEPGVLGFVVTRGPQQWCGMEVPPGSLLVCAPGRDHRSCLSPGFSSLEVSGSLGLLRDAGLVSDSIGYESLPPEQCVVRLEPRELDAVDRWLRLLRDGDPRLSRVDATDVQCGILDLLRRALRGRAPVCLRPIPRYDLAASALRMIEANAGERITVGCLAEALGVTPRALEYAFRSALGVSPGRYLLSLRLHHARRDLLARDFAQVTHAAVHCGFHHLGRFSEQYHRLFGELPSQTLHGGRNLVDA